MVQKNNSTLLIAGGGTGGHVLAGVAVADAWREMTGSSVLFVGASGGIEEKLVPKAGYPLETLKLGSLNRVSLKRKIRTFFQLPLSLLKSLQILWRVKPKVVLGVGGYSSGPMVLMARLLGAKTAILEQNVMPGLTNRWLGRWVDLVFCAFPGAESYFKHAKPVVTGNPVRSAMKPLPSAKRDPFTIFIFGGSQGSIPINSLVIEALPELADLKGKLKWIHQTGEKDFERVCAAHEAQATGARVEKFVYEMAEAYAQSSLLICRSGSSTLSEIAAVGRAAVLIPFPFASDNHQEKNARIFVEVGAAEILIQAATSGKDLANLIRKLLQAPTQISEMEKTVQSFYKPDAARSVVESLMEFTK